MPDRLRRILLRIGRIFTGVVWDVISLAARVLVTLVLILVTTGMLFASIFVIYAKNNMTNVLDVDLEEISLNQTSVVWCLNPDTNEYMPVTSLDSLEDRTWVSYEEIPKEFEQAVVAIEDKRFYTHNGVDWFRTIRAFFTMFLGNEDTFGGSTVTQQLIKNLTEYDDITVHRKLLEIFKALEMEQTYSKEVIMEWYLNRVYFGSGKYGIAAAADYYFGKDISELTVAEIASIVGITNNPSIYSPYIDTEANKSRQENILYQMYQQGYIQTLEEYETAVDQKLIFTSGADDNPWTSDSDIYSYYVDALIEDVIHDLMELKNCNYETAELLLTTGGYQIYSAEDMEIQAIVDDVYGNLENIPETYGSDQQLLSAIVITDPYTGNIVAMAGGVGEKEYNRAQNLATQTLRSPGSAFKPIAVYAPAMDMGLITPDTKFEDSKEVTLSGTSWMTTNYDRTYAGVMTMREAVVSSTNTVAAQVIDMLTPLASYNFLTQKVGVTSLVEYEIIGDREFSDIDYAPLALGQLTYGITVREMAAAYNIFVNNGIFTESRTYTKILDAEGNIIFENIPETTVAISETTAYWMTDVLRDVVSSGTATDAYMWNMPVGGKTGTTSDEYDRWFVGFTPYYVAACWTGYEYPEYISTWGNPATSMWSQVMDRVHENLEYRDFNTPDNTWQAPVPGVTETNYVIRGVDEQGRVLYEEKGKGVEKREIEVKARTLDGYTLVGESTIKFRLNRSETDNIITFVYKSNTPPSPSPTPTPAAPPATTQAPAATDPPDQEMPEGDNDASGWVMP